MIEFIEHLGEKIDASWGKKGYALEAFSQIAFQTLQQAGLHRVFTVEKLLDSLWTKKDLPKQLSLFNGFGQPPITLYRNQQHNFLIDLYFWIQPEISIHSHGFRGAFTVLEGRSFQCRYDFSIRDNLENTILFGDLTLRDTTLLHPGDVQEILAGPSYIHQVWHLSFPTLSLAVRTLEPQQTQYVYLRPHMAFLARSNAMSLTEENTAYFPLPSKKIDTLVCLNATRYPLEGRSPRAWLKALIAETPPHEGFLHLIKYYDLTRDIEAIQDVLNSAPSLGKWAPEFLATLSRMHGVQIKWTQIREEGERFLLALLFSLEEQSDIMRLVRAYNPAEAPEALIVKWLAGLMHRRDVNIQMNHTALTVLERFLYGDSEEEVCRHLSRIYKGTDPQILKEDVRQIRDRLRSDGLLKALQKG